MTRRAKTDDIDQIRRLIDEVFGEKYHKSKALDVENILVFETGNKIISLASWINNYSYNSTLHPTNSQWTLLDMLIVHESHRNTGLGKHLFKTRLQYLQNENRKQFLLKHWIRKGQEKPFIAIQHGFKLDQCIDNYWTEESKHYAYQCPSCFPAHCSCSCGHYLRIS